MKLKGHPQERIGINFKTVNQIANQLLKTYSNQNVKV